MFRGVIPTIARGHDAARCPVGTARAPDEVVSKHQTDMHGQLRWARVSKRSTGRFMRPAGAGEPRPVMLLRARLPLVLATHKPETQVFCVIRAGICARAAAICSILHPFFTRQRARPRAARVLAHMLAHMLARASTRWGGGGFSGRPRAAWLPVLHAGTCGNTPVHAWHGYLRACWHIC